MDNNILQYYRHQLSIQERNMEHKIRSDYSLKAKDMLFQIQHVLREMPVTKGEKKNLSWIYEGDKMCKILTLVKDKLSLFEADTNATINHFSSLSKELGKQSALNQLKRRTN